MLPIRSPLKQYRITAYDLEWLPGTYTLRLASAYDERGYRPYKSVEAFFEHELRPENSGRRYYAHAGGLADLAFFILPLKKAGYYVWGAFSGSSAVILSVEKGGHKWWFIDSLWTLPMPLRKVAKFVGLEKGEVAFDCPLPELIQYNEIDCEIVFRAISRAQAILNHLGGELKPTLASSSLDLLRRKYLTVSVRSDPTANKLGRDCYHASRTEVFRYRCRKANYHDYNSSFGAAMVEAPLPRNWVRTERSISRVRAGETYIVDADVVVEDGCYLPPIPVRCESTVMFPTGSFRATLSEADVTAIEESGGEARIEHIHAVYVFDTFNDFATYAKAMYAWRAKWEPGELENFMGKRLIVSPYGKMGENPLKECLVIEPRNAADYPIESMIAPGVYIRPKYRRLYHEHVPIASAITARGRLSLLRGFRLAYARGNLYYGDTDSIICDAELPTSAGLGGLKLEYQVEEGRFVRPKLYALRTSEEEWLVKSKGFPPKRGSTMLSYAEFIAVESGAEVERERMIRIREMVNNYLRRKDEAALMPGSRWVAKALSEEYVPKRVRLQDGNTRAWQISELRERGLLAESRD